MTRSIWVLLVLASCDNSGDGKGTSSAKPATPQRGSAGGFSASLSADLAKDGSATTPDKPVTIDAGAAMAPASDAQVASAKADAALAEPPIDAAMVATKAIDAAVVATKAIDAATKSADAKAEDFTIDPIKPAKPSADLAAIKLELLPNWERDLGEPGTIVLDVKVRGSTERRTFTFHYGYDDPKAPTDREAYKKFLSEQDLLQVKLDRQRGAAWYLEGVDGNGRAAFRYLVNYGGKHLICYGTLYKDAAGNALGDLRDEVIIQAKKICESLSL